MRERLTASGFTANDLEQGAIQLCKGLWSDYQDLDERTKKVNGDMTKLRYVPNLSTSAKRLLDNIEHTSRIIPGTQETRRQMRFDTNAFRVRYGVPIFVTFSPDESHSLLMLRLSRTRRNDSIFTSGGDPLGRAFCGRREPRMLNHWNKQRESSRLDLRECCRASTQTCTSI